MKELSITEIKTIFGGEQETSCVWQQKVPGAEYAIGAIQGLVSGGAFTPHFLVLGAVFWVHLNRNILFFLPYSLLLVQD